MKLGEPGVLFHLSYISIDAGIGSFQHVYLIKLSLIYLIDLYTFIDPYIYIQIYLSIAIYLPIFV